MSGPFAEGRPEPLEVSPAHPDHPVDWRLQLDLPIGLTAPPPNLAHVAGAHGVVAMHAQEPEAGEDRDQLAEGPHVAQPPRGPQADQRRLACRLEEIDVVGIDRAPSVPGQV